MRASTCLWNVLLLTTAAFAQNTPSVAAKGDENEVRQRAVVAGKQDLKAKQADGPGRLASPPCAFKEHTGPGLGVPCDRMNDKGREWKRCEDGKARQLYHYRFVLLKAFAGMLLLGLTAYATVNVLLTILVSIDMARSGRFNGLWIPILLLVGMPGTVMYALFRIGDIMRSAQTRG
jgi:hypothetical protein